MLSEPGRDELMAELLDSLELVEEGPGLFRAPTVPSDRHVVYGGRLLAQAIMAAGLSSPGKRVKSIQMVFARSLRGDRPVTVSVDTLHAGRAFASQSVDFRQDDRVCARSLVLQHADEPDLIRHQAAMPQVAAPVAEAAEPNRYAAPETIIVDDVDIYDPVLTGPPHLQMWVRFPARRPLDTATSQALLAYATDGWLIATAMRPHAGVGQSIAHKEISTGVVGHSLSFHDEFSADQWCLLDQHAVFAGNGRSYGSAEVFAQDGRHLASYTQDSFIRGFPGGAAPISHDGTTL